MWSALDKKWFCTGHFIGLALGWKMNMHSSMVVLHLVKKNVEWALKKTKIGSWIRLVNAQLTNDRELKPWIPMRKVPTYIQFSPLLPCQTLQFSATQSYVVPYGPSSHLLEPVFALHTHYRIFHTPGHTLLMMPHDRDRTTDWWTESLDLEEQQCKVSHMLVPVHINYFECLFIFPVQSHKIVECQSSAVSSETPVQSHFLFQCWSHFFQCSLIFCLRGRKMN